VFSARASCYFSLSLLSFLSPSFVMSLSLTAVIVRVEISTQAVAIVEVLRKLHFLLRTKFGSQVAGLEFPSCTTADLSCLIDLKVEIDRLVMLTFSAPFGQEPEIRSFLQAAYLVSSYATGYVMPHNIRERFVNDQRSYDVAGQAVQILSQVGETPLLAELRLACQEVQVRFGKFTEMVGTAPPPKFF